MHLFRISNSDWQRSIICVANAGTNFGIWQTYTYQIEVQTIISVCLLVAAEYAVRTNNLSDNVLFTSALSRVRAMVLAIAGHTVCNIAQNSLALVLFPTYVWRLWEIAELYTLQRCLNMGGPRAGGDTNSKKPNTSQPNYQSRPNVALKSGQGDVAMKTGQGTTNM